MTGSFTQDQMYHAISEMMEGKWDDARIEEFLIALSERGETVDEITGAARAMREKVKKINAPAGAVDCCGTGGDQSGTYNISTAVAIVAAACGVTVAKHGNRSASSKSGAADVLEGLGINLDVSHEKLEEALEKFNFAFLMAPRHHSAIRHVMPARKKIGRRTIFNILGPLVNPAGTQYQLIGVYDKDLLRPIAEVLRNLGTKRAWIVHGADGLDEITITAETYVAKLEDGQIVEDTLTPYDFGLAYDDSANLKGGEPNYNAAALIDILDGTQNAYRDIVLANTAAVMVIAGRSSDLKEAVQLAAHAIDSRAAKNLLHNYVEFTQTREQ
ncbi:MAG: anthranilate phosphoribosyltransferase [Alphaproteobacteria bacterium]|nr:anthranilate phosphoribosyltransferase [Alphaproteobacteria bacterium]